MGRGGWSAEPRLQMDLVIMKVMWTEGMDDGRLVGETEAGPPGYANLGHRAPHQPTKGRVTIIVIGEATGTEGSDLLTTLSPITLLRVIMRV